MSNQPVRLPLSSRPHFDHRYVIVIASFLVAMVVVGLFSSIGVFFKPMLNEFGWSRAVISAPIAISGVINGLLSIMMGGLSDKLGPRRVVTLCGILAGAGYLLMSWVDNIWQLYVYLGVFVGSGMSVLVPLVSTIARWFVRRRTIMTGVVVSGGGVGGFIVPLVANWLISSYGWRQSYLILGIAFLVIILAAAQFLQRPLQTGYPEHTASLAVQAASSSDEGLSLKEAVSTRYLWLMMASFFCFGFALGSIQTHIVPHATDLNISATNGAAILSTINGVSIIGNIGMGAIGDKFGNKRLFIFTLALQAITLGSLVYIRELWIFYLFAVLFGLAYGAGLAQQSPLVARVFGINSHGLILGVLSPGQMFGVALGGFLAGYIFDVNGSYQLIFMICAILCIIGLLLTLLISPARRSPRDAALPADG
jgi:MFS family permease